MNAEVYQGQINKKYNTKFNIPVLYYSQVCVVSHASRLIAALNEHPPCHAIALEKDLGQTQIVGQGMLDEPAWYWPDQA